MSAGSAWCCTATRPRRFTPRCAASARSKTVQEKQFSGPEAGTTKDSVLPGEQVGIVTFSDRGHSVGKLLAMAYVKTSHAWQGNRLVVMDQRPRCARHGDTDAVLRPARRAATVQGVTR